MTPVLDADGPANATVVTTAETIVATVSGVNTRPGGSSVILQGVVSGTAGAAAAAVQVRVRRGATLAGAQVGQVAPTVVTALASFDAAIEVDDNPGEIAGQSYVLTVQQIAATGNAVNVNGNLRAEF